MAVKRLRKDIVIEEVASCRQGINTLADMKLLKSKDFVRMGVSLRKADHDEPRTFDEVIEEWNATGISDAIDRRSYAFNQAAWEILVSDESDKASLIITSLRQFAGTLEEDIPDLLAGRLLKALTEPTDMGKLAGIQDIAKSFTKGSDTMAFDPKTLNEEGQAAWAKLSKSADSNADIQKKADAADTFAKACEYAKAVEDFEKSDPDNADPVLKAFSPEQRPFIKAFQAENKDLRAKLEAGATFAKMSRITAEAAVLANVLPLETSEIAEALSKAEDAGDECAKSLRKAYEGTVEMIKAAKTLEGPIGSDMSIGKDDGLMAAQSKLDTMAKAHAKAGNMSFEKAYAEVLDQNPELYADADHTNWETIPNN